MRTENRTIIGISGKAGSGKDTIAQYLIDYYGFSRFAFADAVRETALTINPITTYDWQNDAERLDSIIGSLGWDRAKREISEVRRLLQVIGTEVGRRLFGENVWVNILSQKIEDSNADKIVITDLRFPNEEKYIRSVGGNILVVERPDNPEAIDSSHASEQFTPTADFTISNDSTLESLYDQVDMAMQWLNRPR